MVIVYVWMVVITHKSQWIRCVFMCQSLCVDISGLFGMTYDTWILLCVQEIELMLYMIELVIYEIYLINSYYP